MKILMISHEYPPVGGGGANACMYLSKEYAKAGHTVTVVTVWFEGLASDEHSQGVHILRVKSKRSHKEHCSFTEMADYLLKAWPQVKHLEKEHHFDICQVFFGIPGGPLGYFLKKKFKVPYIIRFGGGDIPGFQDRFALVYKVIGPFLKVIWNNAEALIANSEGLQKMALDFYNRNEVGIINNGVDITKFYPDESKSHVKDVEEINILFVSRLIERKGLQYIIPKLRELQKVSGKKIHLTIVGDGPYRKDLEKLAMENDCERMITFEGQKEKDELLFFYQNADIFILPSKKEGMPNVVLEAMASGLPIIMTPCEGSKELVVDNGYITQIDDMGDRILDLCIYKDKRIKMAQNSLVHVYKNFQWESIGNKYIELMKDIVDN